MTKDEHDLFLMYRDYITELLATYIDIYEGARTPNEIFHIIKGFFSANGIYEPINEYKKEYIPNNDELIVVPIIDHIGLLRTTKDYFTKKAAIDATVANLQRFRDFEGASPVCIAQVNRDMTGLTKTKDGEFTFSLDNVKESGDVGDACDIAISLFDPVKYGQSSKTKYNPNDFIARDTGEKFFRSVQIHKSSYGMDDLMLPLAFNGFCGQFKELESRNKLDEQEYKSLINNVLSKQYFLK